MIDTVIAYCESIWESVQVVRKIMDGMYICVIVSGCIKK